LPATEAGWGMPISSLASRQIESNVMATPLAERY
jgi:hypothetical protein